MKEKKKLNKIPVIEKLSARFRFRMMFTLMIFWIILTGSLHWQQLLTGFIATLFIILFWGEYLIGQQDGFLLNPKNIILLTIYLKDFMIDLVKANIQVAMIVLNPKLPIKPGFIKYKLKLEKTASQVILANSITLTPGTLTVFLDGKEIIVHALTKQAARDVIQWKEQDELKIIEGN